MTTDSPHTARPFQRSEPRARPIHDDTSSPSRASDRDRMGRRVRPACRPSGVRRQAADDGGGVAERPGPGAGQRGGRRAGRRRRQRRRDRDGARAATRTPPTATCGTRRAVRPAGVHPAGRERRPVGDPRPAAGRTDRAGQRDVVEHLTADGRASPPARASAAASTTRNWPLAAAMDGRRDRSARRSGSERQPGPGQQRLHQPAGPTGGELARPRATAGPTAGPAQQGDRGGDGVRRQHDVGVDEHQDLAARRRGELCAGVRLAEATPAAAACRSARCSRGSDGGRGAHDVGRAVGRTVVEHEDLGVGQPLLGEQRADGRRDAVRLVAGRHEHRHRRAHRRAGPRAGAAATAG